VLIWEGKNALHLLSPHQTILYLDHLLLRKLPKRFFITLDSELDKIIPEDVQIYFPKAEDEMNIIEISHDRMSAPSLKNTTLKEFCRIFWANVESKAYLKFFSEDTIDPINRAMLPERDFMDDEAIKQAKQTIRNAIMEYHPYTSIPEQIRIGLEVLEAVQANHKVGRDMAALLAETARQIQNPDR
jgi:hypothetical protein